MEKKTENIEGEKEGVTWWPDYSRREGSASTTEVFPEFLVHFFYRMIELFSDSFTLIPVGILGDRNGPSYFEGDPRKGAGNESLVPVFKVPRTFRFYGKENDGASGSFGENDDTWLGNSRGASRPIHNNAWGFSFAGAFNEFLKSLLSSGGGRSSNDLAS